MIISDPWTLIPKPMTIDETHPDHWIIQFSNGVELFKSKLNDSTENYPRKIECDVDTIEWRDIGGQLHREDGPAIERLNGIQEWYKNGFRHRLDGPAYIDPDGCEAWFLYDMRHCLFKMTAPRLFLIDWPCWFLYDRRSSENEVQAYRSWLLENELDFDPAKWNESQKVLHRLRWT